LADTPFFRATSFGCTGAAAAAGADDIDEDDVDSDCMESAAIADLGTSTELNAEAKEKAGPRNN
jgi:hypothetical protein